MSGIQRLFLQGIIFTKIDLLNVVRNTRVAYRMWQEISMFVPRNNSVRNLRILIVGRPSSVRLAGPVGLHSLVVAGNT